MFSKKLTRWISWIFSALMVFTVFACTYLSLSQLTGVGLRVPFRAGIAIIAALIVLAIAMKAEPRALATLHQLAHTRNIWIWGVAFGVAVRVLAWWLSLPEIQVSDGARYLELANLLYEGKEYQLNGYAFWPPGTPFIYVTFMFFLERPPYLALIVNLVFFLLAATSIRSIVNRLGFRAGYAGLSVAVLAVWPELFLGAGQVSKESILLGLLPCVYASLLSPHRFASIFAGVVAGLAVLTQPSLTFLPLLFGFGLLAARSAPKQIMIQLGAMLIGMILVISPWTYRNYSIFGEFVAVSTNAGLVLHAGNQKAMVRPIEEVGGFLQPPAPKNAFENDLAESRWHAAQAFDFISKNPADFCHLVFNRLVLTMGDDSDSAYRSLRLTGKASPLTYLVFKSICNIFWLALTAFLCMLCWRNRNDTGLLEIAPVLIISTAASLYLMAVHGMAEGGARHHMGWSWAYSLLLALGVAQQSPCRYTQLVRFGPHSLENR